MGQADVFGVVPWDMRAYRAPRYFRLYAYHHAWEWAPGQWTAGTVQETPESRLSHERHGGDIFEYAADLGDLYGAGFFIQGEGFDAAPSLFSQV